MAVTPSTTQNTPPKSPETLAASETSLVTETEHHYKIQLPMWSGPMELLLELIRSSEIDINNISIAQITKDYLTKLESMKRMNIEISSDFLVMGATLVLYKIRSLLGETDDLEEDTESYKEALIHQVLTYEKYKNAATRLEQILEQAPQFILEKTNLSERTATPKPTAYTTEWIPVPLTELVGAFYRLIDRKDQTLEVDSFNEFHKKVSAKIEDILRLLAGPKGLQGVPLSTIARGLMKKHGTRQPLQRSDMIASFIAVLELYKLARIEARQKESFKEIYLFSNEARAYPPAGDQPPQK